jgi:hypothetical protein
MELFWTTLGTTHNMYPLDLGTRGDHPDFGEHGNLLKIIPVKEILMLGFNVIYFDLDVAMLMDPVPYMLASQADFSASIEYRLCASLQTLFSSNYPDIDWTKVEPNAGAMLFRSTANGVKFLDAWINLTIQKKLYHLQRSYRLFHNAQFLKSCPYLGPNTTAISTTKGHKNNAKGLFSHPNSKSFRVFDSSAAKENRPTYCYFSEMLFQTGMFYMECEMKHGPYDNTNHSVEYARAMRMFGVSVPGPVGKNSDSAPAVKYYPVNVHVNPHSRETYLISKKLTMQRLGLWIYNSHTSDQSNSLVCDRFELNNTYWGAL